MNKAQRLEAIQERREAGIQLRKWLKPGDTVYTILDHVSRSGLTHHIRVVLLKTNDAGQPYTLHPNYSVAKLIGLRQVKNGDAIIMEGCGMDMGFQLIYLLSSYLFPEGFGCIGKLCPSNDHTNGDHDYTMHGLFDDNSQPENREPFPGEKADGCINHWHKSGGYALRQQWL